MQILEEFQRNRYCLGVKNVASDLTYHEFCGSSRGLIPSFDNLLDVVKTKDPTFFEEIASSIQNLF